MTYQSSPLITQNENNNDWWIRHQKRHPVEVNWFHFGIMSHVTDMVKDGVTSKRLVGFPSNFRLEESKVILSNGEKKNVALRFENGVLTVQ